MLCFRKIPVARNFTDKRGGGGGNIKIFRGKFFVSQFENFRGGTLWGVTDSGIGNFYA